MSDRACRQAHRNTESATHKFLVGESVYHTASMRSGRELFRVTRLLPDGGSGLQYRIKGEREGFERVVTESSLEAAF
ncbi:MAG TPA: hypothetical protein VFF88_04005 [Methylocella sp.]|nr:hypothetical protein [Methylocella sp.]